MATSASLFLGIVFFLDQRLWARCGSSLHPSIWAVPGAVIPMGSSVTVFCKVPPGVTQVRLNQLISGENVKWYGHTLKGSQEVAEFHLQNMVPISAGVYYCEYSKEGEYWSVSEDKLDLVVTGVYRSQPSLTVHSGPQTVSGGKVTLLCQTRNSYSMFILCRDGNASFPQNCSQQDESKFMISPASPGDGRIFRCFGSSKDKPHLWSLPSDPLELSNQASSPQPSIWAVPGAVISQGSSVTIFCRIPPGVTVLRLIQKVPGSQWFQDHIAPRSEEKAVFSVQNVKEHKAGIYFCQYGNGYHWSGWSDNLELVVTGVHSYKPSLTVQSGPQAGSGGNMTLQCHTTDFQGMFILCRDGNASFPQNCSQQEHSTFLISHASPGDGRTYRCFVSSKDKPHLWSLPSDPLDLSVPNSSASDHRTENYIRLCLAVLVLLVLGALLLDAWKSRRVVPGASQAS